ncbi:hypothetical protein ACFLW8_00220 [Chloroflexota bacterium]
MATAFKMKPGVKAYSEDGNVVAEFYSVKREGDKLIIDSKALGVMRMDMVLPLAEVLRCFKVLVSWATITYLLLIPYFLIRKLFRRQK